MSKSIREGENEERKGQEFGADGLSYYNNLFNLLRSYISSILSEVIAKNKEAKSEAAELKKLWDDALMHGHLVGELLYPNLLHEDLPKLLREALGFSSSATTDYFSILTKLETTFSDMLARLLAIMTEANLTVEGKVYELLAKRSNASELTNINIPRSAKSRVINAYSQEIDYYYSKLQILYHDALDRGGVDNIEGLNKLTKETLIKMLLLNELSIVFPGSSAFKGLVASKTLGFNPLKEDEKTVRAYSDYTVVSIRKMFSDTRSRHDAFMSNAKLSPISFWLDRNPELKLSQDGAYEKRCNNSDYTLAS